MRPPNDGNSLASQAGPFFWHSNRGALLSASPQYGNSAQHLSAALSPQQMAAARFSQSISYNSQPDRQTSNMSSLLLVQQQQLHNQQLQQAQPAPNFSLGLAPSPSSVGGDSVLGQSAHFDIEATMSDAEGGYLNYYRDTLLRAGATADTAVVQAKEAIAKLHEIGYFDKLRSYYMQSAVVSSNQNTSSTLSLPSTSSTLASPITSELSAVTPTVNYLSAPSLTGNSQSPGVQSSHSARSGYPSTSHRSAQSSLFQLKLHSQCYQTHGVSLNSACSLSRAPQNSDSLDTRERDQAKDSGTETKRRRFDKKPQLDNVIAAANLNAQASADSNSGASVSIPTPEITKASSAQDLGSWIQRVYSYHSQMHGSDTKWTKQVSLYISKVVADFRQQKLGDKDWTTEPIPTAQVVLTAMESVPESKDIPHDANQNTRYGRVIKMKVSGKNARSNPSMVVKFSADEQNRRIHRMERFTAANEGRLFGSNVSASVPSLNTNSKHNNGSVDFSVDYWEDTTPDASANADSQGSYPPSCTSTQGRFLTWQEKLELGRSTEKFVGLSTALEKPFLRLCGPPDPLTVRPKEVLQESFKMVVKKWHSDRHWPYCEEQLRSIRQDMTVQGIKSEFALEVYEFNGRVALENLDLGQFNQCQAQLPELYRTLGVSMVANNRIEFLCYRLLYMTLQNMRLDLLRLVGELSDEEKAIPTIHYAMKMRVAVAEGNYTRYFRLAEQAPYKAKYLLQMFSGRMIMSSLITMVQAYKHFTAAFVSEELRFSSVQECVNFLSEQKTVWLKPSKLIDCKASHPIFAASPLLKSRKVSLFEKSKKFFSEHAPKGSRLYAVGNSWDET